MGLYRYEGLLSGSAVRYVPLYECFCAAAWQHSTERHGAWLCSTGWAAASQEACGRGASLPQPASGNDARLLSAELLVLLPTFVFVAGVCPLSLQFLLQYSFCGSVFFPVAYVTVFNSPPAWLPQSVFEGWPGVCCVFLCPHSGIAAGAWDF